MQFSRGGVNLEDVEKIKNVYNKAATAPKNGSETARSRINVYW